MLQKILRKKKHYFFNKINKHIILRHTPELNTASHKLDDIEKLAGDTEKRNNSSTMSIIAYVLAISAVLFISYKLYKKSSKKTPCCGIIPNVCIRVNQNTEQSNNIVRYNRNKRKISQDRDDNNFTKNNVDIQTVQRRTF